MFYLKNARNYDVLDEVNNFFNEAISKEMKTDIEEKEDRYIITCEVAGIKKENVSINVDDENLTIEVNETLDNNEKNNNEKKNYVVKERSSKYYSRSFYLDGIDENSIKAKMENGILTIEAMKVKKPETKKIIEIA